MDTTRVSLLVRVKDLRDTQAWAEFHALYAPLLYGYARTRGLGHADAEDVRAACYEALVKQIPHFKYAREKGGFKAWLRTLVYRRVADLLRKRREPLADSRELTEVPDPEPPADELWDQHWKRQHLRYCVEQVRMAVAEPTFTAFAMLLQDGCTVADVCRRLGMNANQVYKAKARVLELVRQEMALLYSDVPE